MFINVNGIKLYYEVEGQGNPLLLVHGNEEDHRIFDNALPLLKKHYQVYSIDSRGHGQSSKVKEYHYQDMADDIVEFIKALDLKNISYIGSSDGAIIGILVESQHQCIDNLVLCGVNTKPDGVLKEVYDYMKQQYKKTKNPLVKLMLEEPNIKNKELHQIKAKTLLLAGSNDLIKLSHIQNISNHIENSEFKILDGEDHSSYIIHNDKIAKIFLEYFK